VSLNCLPKVTSYERRSRADGPASDRGNITTAARENQHPRLASPAIVGRAASAAAVCKQVQAAGSEAAPVVATMHFP
jgi:hypothetical protein